MCIFAAVNAFLLPLIVDYCSESVTEASQWTIY